jgi:hypothetical protein
MAGVAASVAGQRRQQIDSEVVRRRDGEFDLVTRAGTTRVARPVPPR